MKRFMIASVWLCLVHTMNFGQSSKENSFFKAEVTQNEVLLGNYLEVAFTLENIQNAKFAPPDWEKAGFEVVSGPNQSSQFQMINGQTTSSVTYTYYIRPIEEGKLKIPSVSVNAKDRTYSTEEIKIVVKPNPDGKIEKPTTKRKRVDIWGDPIPEAAEPSKPKRKTTKL